jgi:hypothetical protein
MSKIIRLTKCEGFCKKRGNEHCDRDSSLFCIGTSWYLYRKVHNGLTIDYFRKSFIERCPYKNEQDNKNRK